MVQSLPQSDGFRILFNSPELSEVQRSGFHLFLKKGIAEELSKISCIQLKHAHFLIEIVLDAQDFRLVTPENNYRDCILKMKSYTCKLYVQTKIVFKDKVSGELLYQTQPEWVLLADLPLMTKRGHFVINGSPRVIVHQVGRAPGVYFKKVLKIKKDVNNKARFYGDIIPRKGVWVRLQINKKGEIDLKLKKSKKVRAEMVQKCLELLEREATRENELLKMRSKLIPTKPNKGTMQQNPVKLPSSSVSTSRVQPPFLHLQEKFSISTLHALPKRSLDTTRKGFVLPVSWKKRFFYSGDSYLESNKKKVSFSLIQKRLFFSIQTLFLTGINIDNCFYSKTRQTQAFVTGSSINKPETAIHPIWHNAKPWLTPIRKGSTRVRMICRLKKMVAATKPIPHFVTARFLSNDLIQTKSHLAAKPDSYQRGAFFSKALLCVPSFAEKPLFYKKDAFGSYARVKSRALLVNNAEILPFDKSKKGSIRTELPKLFSEIGFFQIDSSLKYKSGNRNLVSLLKQLRTKQLPKRSYALPKLMRCVALQKRSFCTTPFLHNGVFAQRSYTKTPFWYGNCFGTTEFRYKANAKTKLYKNEVMPCQSFALARRTKLMQKRSFCNRFVCNVRQLLCTQHINPDLTNKLGFPLGSKMYGKTQSAFTKAEKEAFSNVYTSFYKNDIQDIKERASMSFVKRAQDSTKKDSLNPSSLSLTKLSTQLKSKPFKKRVATRKMAKKQSASSNLEKIREYLYQLFKRSDLYDLGVVGREKINTKFGISVIETQLTALDIKETINWLSKLRAGKEEIDDIDHSQNRRVRTSSELIQTQFETGITRLRNVVTKKVRSGKIEQIKALPLTLRTRLSRTETKDLAEQSFGTCASLTHPNSKLIGYYQKNDVSQPLRLKEKSINSACIQSEALYALPCFKGQGGCFVKNNKIIDKVKLRLKNKKTFTSINPYFITHQRKKKYYSNRSELKSVRQKLHSRWDLLSVFHQPLMETHRMPKLGSALPKQLPKQSGTKTSLYGISFGKAYKAGKMSLEEKPLFVPHIQSKAVTQDVLYPQGNRLSNFSVSELFSTKPINGALREFFSSSSLSQYMDQTNPLAEITHKRRISSLGVGGVSRESAGMAIRGIHPTHYGRICPIETPEGKNAGLVNSLAFYARINNQGFIETPYYQVIKGQIQHELGFSFYSAGQESRNGLHIAPNDIKQSKSKLLATSTSTVESIPVRVADNVLDLFKKVSPYKVDCIGISPVQILSVATSLIPFLEHNDANRALMGSNMQRQAVSLMISERPLIGTGLEARVLAESGHLVQSKVSGVVSSVSAHKVVVERLLHNLVSTSCVSYKPNANIKSDQNFVPYRANAKTKLCKNYVVPKRSYTKTPFLYGVQSEALYATQRLCVQRVQSPFSYTTPSTSPVTGDKLPVTAFLEAGTLQISSGRSSLLAKLCFARISGKAKQWSVKERNMNKVELLPYRNLFSSQPRNVYIESSVARTQLNKRRAISFTKKKFALLPVTHSISTFSRSNQETCLVQKPLVEEGDWVQKGDMVSDCSAGQKGELSVGKNMLIAYIPWQGYNFEDAIVISDRLVKEQLYTSLHIERYTVIVNDFKDKVVDTNEWFTGNLPGVDSKKRDHLQRSGLPVIGTTLREGDILVGKIKYSKKKPATPHEKLVCDILGEHNFSVQNSSLYVPKGVHEARVLTYKIKKRFDKALKNNLRPAGAPKVVDIFLGEKRNIQVGDKMSGRHGNKGIVSTILPKQDMPYLADGSPIDILLNPLGVPSRMNVGQVFECLLGLASTYLHQNFKMTAFDELYGVEASQSLVFLKLYQARLQSGQNWLFQVNFPGKTRLTDGRSGECLDQWVTVGRAYMLKLIHMVNEKIHARAIGPYALVTQQPLKGRAHKGGQRLGEMEVWAIEGFGAAYILQELLTKKSDDSIGRKEVLKAMLPKSASFLDSFDPFNQQVQTEVRLGLDNESMRSRNENRSHNQDESFNVLGQPDIFKVLICELQALCLDVGVYSMKTESFQRQFLGILE